MRIPLQTVSEIKTIKGLLWFYKEKKKTKTKHKTMKKEHCFSALGIQSLSRMFIVWLKSSIKMFRVSELLWDLLGVLGGLVNDWQRMADSSSTADSPHPCCWRYLLDFLDVESMFAFSKSQGLHNCCQQSTAWCRQSLSVCWSTNDCKLKFVPG